MKFQYLSLLALSLLKVEAYGTKPAKTDDGWVASKEILWGCKTGLGSFKFGYSNDQVKKGLGTAYYDSMCGYNPAVASMMICFEEKFGAYTEDFNKSAARMVSICKEYDSVTYTVPELYDIYDNGTKYALTIDKTVNYTTTILYQPIKVNIAKVEPTFKYYMEVAYNLTIGNTFAGILYLYFVFIFIIFSCANLLKRTGLQRKFNNKLINWYRANISIPATFNGHHTDAKVWFKIISTLIPTRVESIVVFLFICLNVLLTAVNYHPRGTVSADYRLVLYRDIANRTGVISFGLIPLLIIFSGRNNVLTTITGIPYTSLIFYHKWVARAMWIHALIHSACWTGYVVINHTMEANVADPYWRWGIVATILGGLILFQAFHFFRNSSYEVFLFVHIVLVILFIVGCWWHCFDLGYLEWLYASWAVWIFDRLVRIVRLTIFGIQNAQIEFVGDETFRITVPYNKWFMPFPGSFGYIYFFTKTTFWQSHPFTIIKSITKENHLTFYIKSKGGITKKIHSLLNKSPNGVINMKVSIEGPYGQRAPTDKYDKVLFFAGGNGIPGLYSHVMDLSKREVSSKQVLKLLWVVRSNESLSWFSEELKALCSTNAQIDIFITGRKSLETTPISSQKKNSSGSETSDNEKHDTTNKSHMELGEEIQKSLEGRVTFHDSRPAADDLILKEFTDESGPSVAVMSCGAPKMVDQVRASVANHLQKSKGRVDLFEELQVW